MGHLSEGARSARPAAVGEAPLAAAGLVESVLQASTEYSIIGKDLQGKILLWNEGAHRIYGYEAAEIVGVNAGMLHTAADVAAGKPAEIIATALNAGKWEGVIERKRKDASRFWARLVVTPRYDAAGIAIGVLVISKDITEEMRSAHELANAHLEREAAVEALRSANRELAQASEAKDRFLASMSHELRTPLNAIIGYAGVQLMGLAGPLSADQRMQMQSIESSGNHLLSLINGLLDLAKIEAGRVDVSRERVDCCELLEEIVATVRPLADEKGLALVAVPPPAGFAVETDRRMLSQILLNLAGNAIKFTEEGQVAVTIGSHPEDGGVARFAVHDTGMGIDARDGARVFDAFEQVADVSAPRQEGTGLGLHISRRLALLLGGQLEFTSEPGRGSTFWLDVPREVTWEAAA
jgi:PAS domain S-box-containing protein